MLKYSEITVCRASASLMLIPNTVYGSLTQLGSLLLVSVRACVVVLLPFFQSKFAYTPRVDGMGHKPILKIHVKIFLIMGLELL